MEEVIIKPLEEISDIEGLRHLYNSSIKGGDFILYDREFSYEEELVWYRKMIDNILAGNNLVYVAVLNGEIAGICEARKGAGRESRNVSLGVLVRKEHRGKGIGKALLEYTISKAKEAFRPKNIWLSVVEANERALSLYRSLGFNKIAELKDWYFKDGKYYSTFIMAISVE
ncbi:MAG: GNAT family N-acetyltransferase [Candidatus Anstonellales archaeon]